MILSSSITHTFIDCVYYCLDGFTVITEEPKNSENLVKEIIKDIKKIEYNDHVYQTASIFSR